MAILVPNDGEKYMLDTLVVELLNGASLRLYSNDYTPDENSLIGNFVEATFGGYAAVALTQWGQVTTNAGGEAYVEEVQHDFAWTGAPAETIFGYYVMSPGDNRLIYAERNPGGGVLLNAVGHIYSVHPRFCLRSKPPDE